MCTDPYMEEIDWNEVWKARRMRARAMKADIKTPHWDKVEEAERYAREADLGYRQRIDEEMKLLPFRPDSRVLDIGSGPGPLTLPLASEVSAITAVEPAAGMVRVLSERVRDASLSNVSWVQKAWEDIDIATDLAPPYDLVIASFSLVMDDIRMAIEKMQEVCSGWIYLFTFVDGPLWEQLAQEVWTELLEVPYYRGPKADVLWNLLYQMGIYANVLIRPLNKTYRFSSMEVAVDFFAGRFGVTTESRKISLEQYLAGLNMASDDSFLLSRDTTYATIWWSTLA
jgi:SAM-dependent methyltransferase